MHDNYKIWRKISKPQYIEARLKSIYNVTLQSWMRLQSENGHMTFYKYTVLDFLPD